MNVRSARQRWLLACCALVLAIGVALGVSKWIAWSFEQKFDLGNKPTEQVFMRIFRAPPPPEVFNLKIAGEAHLGGVFWMRGQAKDIDAVLDSLKRNPAISITGQKTHPNPLPTPQQIAQDDYATAVGWSNVLRIEKPEYYEFWTNPTGTGWFGTLAIDRTQNVIYGYGGLH